MVLVLHCTYAELIGSPKLGNVWVFVQLIHKHMRTKNQLYKKPQYRLT